MTNDDIYYLLTNDCLITSATSIVYITGNFMTYTVHYAANSEIHI